MYKTKQPSWPQVGMRKSTNLTDPVTQGEVERLNAKVNVSKSSGIELLSTKLLKDSFHALSDRLTHLFNLSLRTASFTDQKKKAVFIPIPKIGDLKKVDNYRPISLLPLPGNILEKIIHAQIMSFCQTVNLDLGSNDQRHTLYLNSSIRSIQISTSLLSQQLFILISLRHLIAFNTQRY